MNELLVILSGCLLVLGLIGCVVPVIPAVPLSFLGLLLFHFSEYGDLGGTRMLILSGISIAAFVLDQLISVWGVKRFGGSKAGIRGSIIGLVAGMFLFPPFGIILGPFAGAVIGEMAFGSNTKKALKIGLGALIGFFVGTILKIIICGYFLFLFISEFIEGISYKPIV